MEPHMAEDMTDEEVVQIALGVAEKGGELGRAIFYKICLMSEKKPEFVLHVMETELPKLPKGDRDIILYVLDEYSHARNLDLRKVAEDYLQGAIFQALTR